MFDINSLRPSTNTDDLNQVLVDDYEKLSGKKANENPKAAKQFVEQVAFREKADTLFALADEPVDKTIHRLYGTTYDNRNREVTQEEASAEYLKMIQNRDDRFFNTQALSLYNQAFPSEPLGYYQKQKQSHTGYLGEHFIGRPYIPFSNKVQQRLPDYAGKILYKKEHPNFPKILSDIMYGVDPSSINEHGHRKGIKIYTRQEQDGSESWWAFPSRKRVSNSFSRVSTREITDIIGQDKEWDWFAEFSKKHEVPGGTNIPGKRGERYYTYHANEGSRDVPIIGWGHNMEHVEKTQAIFNEINPELNAQAVLQGQQGLTLNELEQVLMFDLKEAWHKAQMLIPNLHRMPSEVQKFVVDASLWTMLQHSDRTVALINEWKFSDAAEEWIDNKTYRGNFNRPRFEEGQELLREAQAEWDYQMGIYHGEHGD